MEYHVPMKPKEWLWLFVWIGICQGAGVIGSLFTAPAIVGWYAGLEKSFLNPPGWVFGPVWTLLFTLMGIAAFLVWRQRGEKPEAKKGIRLFIRQLVLNVLWSVMFFGFHDPFIAFVDIVVLWIVIVATIYEFRKVSEWAAWLMVPYLLWVSFASYLNLAVVLLN